MAERPRKRYAFEPDEPPVIPVPEFGPYDIAVAPDDDVPRLDLGALLVPNLPDVQLQVEASPAGEIQRIQLEHQGGRLQLAAFAAPRSEGIWDEVRTELRTALLSNGAKVVEVDDAYGLALAAQVPSGPGAALVDVRHLGIDGPRWFVHAVLVGPAAVDKDGTHLLREVLRSLVVDRGTQARPVKEALPLRLPGEMQAQLTAAAAARARQTKTA